jgi:hypothetical protein
MQCKFFMQRVSLILKTDWLFLTFFRVISNHERWTRCFPESISLLSGIFTNLETVTKSLSTESLLTAILMAVSIYPYMLELVASSKSSLLLKIILQNIQTLQYF